MKLDLRLVLDHLLGKTWQRVLLMDNSILELRDITTSLICHELLVWSSMGGIKLRLNIELSSIFPISEDPFVLQSFCQILDNILSFLLLTSRLHVLQFWNCSIYLPGSE
jgi:hypothetical protein